MQGRTEPALDHDQAVKLFYFLSARNYCMSHAYRKERLDEHRRPRGSREEFMLVSRLLLALQFDD